MKLMKKIYLEPTIEVTRIEVQSLIMNSVESVSGLDGVSTSDEELNGGDADSRIFDLTGTPFGGLPF